MKHPLLSALAAGGLALGLAAAAAVPASAVTVTLGSGVCQTIDTAGANTAKSEKNTCTSVLSRIVYLDGGGAPRTAYGSWGPTSIATASTLQVTNRAVNVQLGSTTTGYISY